MNRIAVCWIALLLGGCGGSLAQSQECRDYLSCYGRTGGNAATLELSYGAKGTCWSTTTAAAAACTDACKAAALTLAPQYPDAGC